MYNVRLKVDLLDSPQRLRMASAQSGITQRGCSQIHEVEICALNLDLDLALCLTLTLNLNVDTLSVDFDASSITLTHTEQ
jgi:hypothetical protein